MKPPICAFCGKDFRPDIQEGGLVSFPLSPEDQAYNERMAREKMVGHPRGQAWFCGEHYAQAEKLSKEYQLKEALDHMRKKPVFGFLKGLFSSR